MPIPRLETRRLTLRPFDRADAPEVARLVGDHEVNRTLLNVPHPYTLEMAETWIGGQADRFERGGWFELAIVRSEDGRLLGAVGLHPEPKHERAEIGYWIGREHQGRGHATEAAGEIVRYAFEERNLHRVFARCLARNRASARVLEKLGMVLEGHLREHTRVKGVRDDRLIYGILAREFRAR